jgi:hypothetical protein
MQKTYFSRLRVGRLLALIAILLTVLPLSSANAQTATAYDFGLICENQTAPGVYTASVDVTAEDGYISIPDGNTIYMWGFGFGTPATAAYQHPGPTLCFTEGQAVSVTVHNTLPEAVSVIFPGQTGVAAAGGVAPVNSLAQMAATGGTVTYNFTAGRAGTFIYESGSNLQKQVQMGLFGAIIVRPTLGANYVYDWAKSQFNQTPFSNDYLMLLSEIDPDWHAAVESAVNDYAGGGAYNANPFNVVDYHPRYWQINGRSFPDTIAPNKAPWLPTQPYGALLHILPSAVSVIPNDASGAPASETSDPTKYQQFPSAVRVLNVGMLNHPIHPHGNHVQVIGRDGHPLLGPANEDLSYSKFNIMAGAGQAWDVLYDWTNKDYYNPDTNAVPYGVDTTGDVTTPGGSQDNLTDPRNLGLLFKPPNFFSGSPYLGYQANKTDGNDTSYNQCGEYYQIWHSHALDEAANYETGFGGMLTLERIDPPGHFNCAP